MAMVRWCLLLLIAPAVSGLLAACGPLQGFGTQREPVGERPVIPRRLPAQATASAYGRMVREAREWQERASAAGAEWRDVEPLLRQAERVAQQGDYAKAIELAEYARFQAEMGYLQRAAQEKVEQPPYLRGY